MEITSKPNSIIIDGREVPKSSVSYDRIDDGIQFRSGLSGKTGYYAFSDIIADGDTFNSKEDLYDWLSANSFKSGGTGQGTDGVQSVTGNLVKGTSKDPIIDLPELIANHPSRTDNPHNVTKSDIGLGAVDNTSDADKPISSAVKSELDKKPTLDNSGKIPLEFLNVSGLQFKGAWNASTNTPALLDGTGSVGDFYKVSVAGTYNFGNGEHTFVEGDWVMFAAGVWQRIGVHETVQSVNGKIGTVVISKSDIGLGNADNTSDANKPVSIAQKAAIDNKQDKLVSGSNIKTIAGQSLMGSGNIILPGVSELISSTVQDGFTINEYVDRTEYLAKIITPNTTVGTGGGRYQTYTSTYRLPEGITINGADWCEINLKNTKRTISVAVYDNTNRYIAFGYFNNYNDSGSEIASPVLFIKLIYNK